MDREVGIRTSCLYLKAFYKTKKHHAQRIEITPFHAALLSADLEAIKRIIQMVGDSEVIKTVLNTPLVDLKKQQVRIKDIPRELIYVATILDQLTSEEVQVVGKEMGTKFHVSSNVNIMSRLTAALYLELPLFLACAGGNKMIVRTLLNHGSSLEGYDSKQENVFHNLVRLSEKAPKTAVSMFNFIVDEISDFETNKSLLLAPNLDGRHPLDLAAKLGLPEMLLAIMNIEDVYKFVLTEFGLVQLVRYDLTKYESFDVHVHNSILYQLTNMNEPQMARALKCKLLQSEPFDSWIRTKFDSRTGLMRIFICFWIILMIFFTLTVMTFVNGQVDDTYLAITASLAAAYLIVEFSHGKANFREIREGIKGTFVYGHFPVTFTFAYRFLQIAFCCFVIFSALCYPIRCSYPRFMLATFVISSFLGALSFLFFIQTQSNVGHLLIVLQKVIYDTSFFMFIMFLFYAAFAVSLFLLHHDLELATCALTHPNMTLTYPSCSKHDRISPEMGEALYETVLLMFTVIAPQDFLFKCAHIPWLAILLYVLLLIIISTILVNLLIAIMTQRVDEIAKMKDDILKLERISIVLYLEERLRTMPVMTVLGVCHHAYKHISKPFRRWKKKNIFRKKPTPSFVRTDDGQVFLDLVETLLEDRVPKKNSWF